MLDGRDPDLVPALEKASDEFFKSQQFLEEHRGVFDALTDDNGKVDYRLLEETLGGKAKETGHFFRDLHLARSALAIRRKALMADAAAHALADPANPYAAMRKRLESQAYQLDEADAIVAELTERLSRIELKGRRLRDRDKSVTARQEHIRAQVSPPAADGDTEVLFLTTASGEILQLLPAHEDEPSKPTADEGVPLPALPDNGDAKPGRWRTATTRSDTTPAGRRTDMGCHVDTNQDRNQAPGRGRGTADLSIHLQVTAGHPVLPNEVFDDRCREPSCSAAGPPTSTTPGRMYTNSAGARRQRSVQPHPDFVGWECS
ncbi:hypothetical protein ACFQS1_35150 [Paractinoplanes rhizophilus]|uniref:Uncharacterized protein n=1 Tax=Paractinoplanes rhizophilus TaxID=1416877 RepID=A0ABW2I2Y0_9ACTN